MRLIKTRDQSITYFNEKFQEAYHSTSVGAIEEAEKKYVEPANLKEGATILDFCFGLGYNSLAVLMKLNQVTIIAIENDPEILKAIETMEVPEPYQEKYKIIKKVAKEKEYNQNNIKIKLIVNDAAKTIQFLTDQFDAVLFDPFSPKKHPELWTQQIFNDLHKIMKPQSTLTTYSCATHVREKLKQAGFTVKDGPILGRKSPSTIAFK